MKGMETIGTRFYSRDVVKAIANTAALYTRYSYPERWHGDEWDDLLDMLEENWRGMEGHA